uniref:Uncharacterized protein n=1 Tax=Kalanchoe fedtschenkoi TaxID=63787 RepID=A0A7N0T3G2_KALFE
MVVMEKDERTALFFEMRRAEAEDQNLPALNNSDDFDGCNPGSSPISKMVAPLHVPLIDDDDFLNFENDTTDYDWLLTPPDIPLFPSMEMESQKRMCSQIEIFTVPPTLNTEPADTQEDALSITTSGLVPSAFELDPISAVNKIQSVSKNPIAISAAAKPSRSSTPNSRAPLLSNTKLKSSCRRSSPPSRLGSHSSTPTATLSTSAASKLAPRSCTPIRKKPSSSGGPCVTALSSLPSAVVKSAPLKSKHPVDERGKVLLVKSCTGRSPETLDVSLDVPPLPSTLLRARSVSASKGESAAVSDHKIVSSVTCANGKQRQKSCSPSVVRVPNSSGFNRRNFISTALSNDTDIVNPVIIGTQMVERVVNMRKLAPPKPDGQCGHKSSSSRVNSGFGLSLSKKSLDMAIRHMSIRGNVSDNLKPSNMKIAASSGHNTMTESTKSSTSLTDSPFTTSSDASSDRIVHCN